MIASVAAFLLLRNPVFAPALPRQLKSAPRQTSPPGGLKDLEFAPNADGHPRLLILRSPHAIPVTLEREEPQVEASVAASTIASLRRRKSVKYDVFTPTRDRMEKAYNQAGVTKLGFNASADPTTIYPFKGVQDVGQILGTPYVLYIAWYEIAGTYLHDESEAFVQDSKEDWMSLRAAITVIDVRDGSTLSALKVVEFTKPVLRPMDDSDRFFTMPSTRKNSERLGDFMGSIIFDELQKLPFKP